MKQTKLSRRRAVGSLATAVTSLSAGVFSGVTARTSMAANEKLQIACIGVANRASANLKGVSSQAIVAICDIDDVYLDRVATAQGTGEEKTPPMLPDARQYHDYREMIEKEVGRVDAVVVSTADHHHVPASIRAIRKGMHVYCEKPLSHTVAEARLVAQEAKRMGVATQLGTQIHASDNYRRVVEVIRSGAIGDVGEVHVWVGKGWGGGDRPVESVEPPSSLHWDLWLGPAPVRPFVPKVYHPAQWRRWWDFGNGTLGDMGCHYMDLPFWALDLKSPTQCKAEGPPVHPETCPTGLVVHYDFPSRGKLPPVHLTWYDGSMTPEEVKGQKVPRSGVMFVGTEGMMFANYGSYRLYPEKKFADFDAP
ncbi:MAG: Gfo/Idh/MocA family oxidoreductase, partial [Pirellulales bacterium]